MDCVGVIEEVDVGVMDSVGVIEEVDVGVMDSEGVIEDVGVSVGLVVGVIEVVDVIVEDSELDGVTDCVLVGDRECVGLGLIEGAIIS